MSFQKEHNLERIRRLNPQELLDDSAFLACSYPAKNYHDVGMLENPFLTTIEAPIFCQLLDSGFLRWGLDNGGNIMPISQATYPFTRSVVPRITVKNNRRFHSYILGIF